MLSMNILIGSLVSLATAQTMSLIDPSQPLVSCNFLSCAGSILGGVETCLNTGTSEEVLTCVENILNSVGQGDCLACICDVIPALCQGNNMIIPETRSDLEDKDQEEKDSQKSCPFLACAGYILGAVETCVDTGSTEEVFKCVKKILDGICLGECNEII